VSDSKLPGIISAVTVLVVLGLLGVMLYNRSGGQELQQTASGADAVATPDLNATAMAMAQAQATAEAASAPATEEAPAEEASAVDEAEEAAAGEESSVAEGERAAALLPSEERENMYSEMPPMTIDPNKEYIATIDTPRGDIKVRLLPEIAPQTVNSFVFLAREGFYDGLTWHRVIQNFMAQGGDPTGTGTGGPGYNVPAEFTDKIKFDRPGLLAMARASDPNSAGSQFFITTAPTPHLNNQYTIFGEVIEGQDIVNTIPLRDPATATTPGETIESISITEQ
jgi:cyclophilin family peptidyl-prolyl cis-trans isomerase